MHLSLVKTFKEQMSLSKIYSAENWVSMYYFVLSLSWFQILMFNRKMFDARFLCWVCFDISFIYLVDFVSCLFLLQSCELTHVTLGFSHNLSSACRRKNIIYKIIKIPNTKLYCSFDIMKGKSRLVLDLYTKEMKY